MFDQVRAVLCRRPAVTQSSATACSALKRRWCAAALAAIWLATVTANAERSVTLAWDRSPDTSVVGYRVYTREENSKTTTSVNVLGLTQVTLPGLKEGLRYTFSVAAYNAAGMLSAPSSAVEFVVPVPLNLLPGTNWLAAKRLQFPMAPGHWYELQSSTDLTNWITLWQTGVANSYTWTEFTDARSGPGIVRASGYNYLQRCFYRLQVH